MAIDHAPLRDGKEKELGLGERRDRKPLQYGNDERGGRTFMVA